MTAAAIGLDGQPMPDRNADLRKKLTALAREKPRWGYRRLGAAGTEGRNGKPKAVVSASINKLVMGGANASGWTRPRCRCSCGPIRSGR